MGGSPPAAEEVELVEVELEVLLTDEVIVLEEKLLDDWSKLKVAGVLCNSKKSIRKHSSKASLA